MTGCGCLGRYLLILVAGLVVAYLAFAALHMVIEWVALGGALFGAGVSLRNYVLALAGVRAAGEGSPADFQAAGEGSPASFRAAGEGSPAFDVRRRRTPP